MTHWLNDSTSKSKAKPNRNRVKPTLTRSLTHSSLVVQVTVEVNQRSLNAPNHPNPFQLNTGDTTYLVSLPHSFGNLSHHFYFSIRIHIHIHVLVFFQSRFNSIILPVEPSSLPIQFTQAHTLSLFHSCALDISTSHLWFCIRFKLRLFIQHHHIPLSKPTTMHVHFHNSQWATSVCLKNRATHKRAGARTTEIIATAKLDTGDLRGAFLFLNYLLRDK